MKKSKIVSLSFLTVIPVLCLTPFLTSCTTGRVNEFCNEITIRDYIPNQNTYYPVYASPTNEAKRMAPNFLAMWKEENLDFNTTWVDKYTGWLDNLIDDEGKIDSNFTYQHLFLNESVCQEFGVDPTDKVSSLSDLYDHLVKPDGVWDLSSCYLHDKYADETVKALNNPWFYELIKDSNSIASNVTKIDLSNNNLWYVPFFGYCSAPIYKWLYGGVSSDSAHIGFKSLTNINLKNNEITTLPHDQGINSTNKDDITKFTTTNSGFTVDIDNNHMAYNFASTFMLSQNYKFVNESAIKYTLDDKQNTIQSYAIYQDDKYIRNYLNYSVRTILGSSINPQNIPLDSYNEELQKNVANLASSNKYKVGSCYAQIIINYFNADNLFSSYIYSELTGLPEIIFTLIEGTDYGFCYPEYSVNKGSIKLSFDLGDPRIVKQNNQDNYEVDYPASDAQSFIATHVDKYCVSGWTSTFMIIILSLLGTLAFVLLVYFLYFKRYLANKIHKEEMIKIKKIEKELMEKGSK